MVDKFKKDYPEDYQQFLKYVEFKRSNADNKKFAEIRGTTEIRQAAAIPQGIMNTLDYALKEEELFKPKGELKWFLKKYPEFLIPRSY